MFFYKDIVVRSKSKDELFNSKTVCPLCGGPLYRDWSMPVRYSPMAMLRFLILTGAFALLTYLLVHKIEPVHVFLDQFRQTVQARILTIGLACISIFLAFGTLWLELRLGHLSTEGKLVYGCRCKTCKNGFVGLVDCGNCETCAEDCEAKTDQPPAPTAYIISGPSGVGKSTIVRMLKEVDLPLRFPVSATDRAPRPGELEGISYHFKTPNEFQQLIDSGAFIEYVQLEHLEHRYGTLRSEIENASDDIILDLDVTGALKIREQYDAVLIFIAPPSMEELERRLRERNDGMSESELQRRLVRSKHELDYIEQYDFVIINDGLQQAFEEVLDVIKKSKNNSDLPQN